MVLSALCCIVLLCRAGFCVVFFPEIFPTKLLVFSDFFFSGAPAIRNVVLFVLFVIVVSVSDVL